MKTATYSPETIRELEGLFARQNVHRRRRVQGYEPGTELSYEARSILPDGLVRLRLAVEKFVGGGFAGQVYKVKLLAADILQGTAIGFEPGRSYALKILIPPSGIGRRIRDLFFGIGFQAPFSLQSLASAGRSQALWQKFIKRAARIEFGRDDAVVDIFATLLDSRLGSYGEISEWVDGRMWRFEVDDDLDARRAWKVGAPDEGVGSPEYRTKREFMARLVRLMHRMGAIELARQYEWWSLKSQPNAMKRKAGDPDPEAGLVAVDFRAGMALMPFLPQCPADVKLIFQGLGRGRLVQFDKGDIRKLESFVDDQAADFADLRGALDELKHEDRAYRDSLIDVTFHHLKLFGRRLRRTVMNGFRESWRVRNKTDEKTSHRLETSGILSFLFLILPFLALASPALFVFAWPGRTWWKYPLWLVPLWLVPFTRKLWGRADLRKHYGKIITSVGYFLRASRARIAEAQIRWVRAGRVSEARALRLARTPWRYYLHLPFSFLPAGLHRFLTDGTYFKQRLSFIFVRPLRLYFNAAEREKWLREMIDQGVGSGILGEPEAARIRGQLKEPFIQKYLKSLAVHVCTLPITQVVSVALAIIYVKTHPELSWQQASVAAGMILALFQVIPISPGSFTRGLYTTFLVLKERNFKDYKVAFGLSYFKYIGYLAFPIQMAYRYPDLARFMAGHWATGAVHIVPIFGEKGAWLEHFVFDTFYNLPLTVQRRMKRRAEIRKARPPRAWHVPLIVLGATAVLGLLDFGFFKLKGRIPAFGDIWWLAAWVPFLAAWLATRWAGGASVGKRVAWAILGGIAAGALWTFLGRLWIDVLPGVQPAAGTAIGKLALKAVWQAFIFAFISAAGAFIAETRPFKRGT